MDDSRLRSDPGTYALLLQTDTPQTIAVGALGELAVGAGRYVYVGSAFGPGGVRARVHRHARGDGATHWHIDYLRAVATLTHVWWTHDDTRRECEWAAALRDRLGATVPLRGFGASDCTCQSHLGRIEADAEPTALRAALRADAPIHGENAESWTA